MAFERRCMNSDFSHPCFRQISQMSGGIECRYRQWDGSTSQLMQTMHAESFGVAGKFSKKNKEKSRYIDLWGFYAFQSCSHECARCDKGMQVGWRSPAPFDDSYTFTCSILTILTHSSIEGGSVCSPSYLWVAYNAANGGIAAVAPPTKIIKNGTKSLRFSWTISYLSFIPSVKVDLLQTYIIHPAQTHKQNHANQVSHLSKTVKTQVVQVIDLQPTLVTLKKMYI